MSDKCLKIEVIVGMAPVFLIIAFTSLLIFNPITSISSLNILIYILIVFGIYLVTGIIIHSYYCDYKLKLPNDEVTKIREKEFNAAAIVTILFLLLYVGYYIYVFFEPINPAEPLTELFIVTIFMPMAYFIGLGIIDYYYESKLSQSTDKN